MPDKTVCPHCRRAGFVRMETVVKGGDITKAYFCGACGWEWAVPDERSPMPDRRRSARGDRRHKPA